MRTSPSSQFGMLTAGGVLIVRGAHRRGYAALMTTLRRARRARSHSAKKSRARLVAPRLEPLSGPCSRWTSVRRYHVINYGVPAEDAERVVSESAR